MKIKHYIVKNIAEFSQQTEAMIKLEKYLNCIDEVVFPTIEKVFGQKWNDDQINIKFENSKDKYTEVREYRNTDPKFELKLGNDWAILEQNLKDEPVKITNKKIRQAFYYVDVQKADESNINYTNQEYLDWMKKMVEEINKSSLGRDFNIDVFEYNADVAINETVSGAMKTKTIVRNPGTGEIQSQSVEYFKKIGDKYLDIGFDLYSDDGMLYNEAEAELNKMLEGFTL